MATCLLAMESDHHHSPHQDQGEFQWMSMGGYSTAAAQSASPVAPTYHPYGYSSPNVTPIEPAPVYGVARPPPYNGHQQLQPLHPLIVPQWPSMLTAQSTYSTPTIPTPATTTPSSAVSASPSSLVRQTTTGGSTPRRTLTDEDRRRMCQYAEDNPGIKQNDIGIKFGVERSTVSKVLRQKEKYLFPQDGSQSPVKKSKGKFPDIERALANWARNESKKYALTDSMIRDKARFFSTTVGNNESLSKLNSTVWLEKFKQKNNLLGGRLKRSPTDHRNLHDDGNAILDSSTTSTSHASEMSPQSEDNSPTGSESSHGTAKHDLSDGIFDLPHNSYQFHHQSGSHSAGYHGPSLVSSPASPQLSNVHASPFYSPDGSNRLPSLASAFSRPRSQTVPNLNFDAAALKVEASEEITPKLPEPSIMNILESPLDDKVGRSSPYDMVKRNNSYPGIPAHGPTMQPPPRKSEASSPSTSPIGSVTHQEARQALELVITFFRNQPVGMVDPNEYMTMGKLMQKLEVTHGPDGLPGGLHRIDEEEDRRVTKKRSIRSL